MPRATQFTIGWSMVALAIIGYFIAFPELAVLLGRGAATPPDRSCRKSYGTNSSRRST